MEIVKEEKDSVEQPSKGEQKVETGNTDVEMKSIEMKENAPVEIKQEQPSATPVSPVPVVQVCRSCYYILRKFLSFKFAV